MDHCKIKKAQFLYPIFIRNIGVEMESNSNPGRDKFNPFRAILSKAWIVTWIGRQILHKYETKEVESVVYLSMPIEWITNGKYKVQ